MMASPDRPEAPLLRRMSKRMALLLRHAPERAGLVLDPEGYVLLQDLVRALQTTETIVRAVVEHVEPHKQRYSIAGDSVRANYGHSTALRIEHEKATPPDVLLHGTSVAVLPLILRDGLWPMARQYVHMTPDDALATSVGARHGQPCLVRVDARAAHAAGVEFFKANESFWLAREVPASYLTQAEPA